MGAADDVTFRQIVPEVLAEDSLASFARLLTRIRREIRADDDEVGPAWVLARYFSQSETFPKTFVIAEKASEVVGFGHIELDRTGANSDAISLEVIVDPRHRRQGIGTTLLDHAIDIGRAEGADSLVAWGVNSDAAAGFWRTNGGNRAFTSTMNRLWLDSVDRDLLTRWIAAAQPARDAGYRLLSWRGACPQEHLAQFVGALGGMADAPLDDLEITSEVHTPVSVRQHEHRWIAVGSTPWVMLVIAPDGSPAAMTEVLVHDSLRSALWQEGTTTLAAHRRQGLGRWIKAAMLTELMAAGRGDFIQTATADSNSSMRSINEALGFSRHARYAGFQAPMAGVRT